MISLSTKNETFLAPDSSQVTPVVLSAIMTKIEDIVKGFDQKFYIELHDEVSYDDLVNIEGKLEFKFDDDYKEFCLAGCLNYGRISHDMIPLNEILDHQKFLKNDDLIPFASDGCGGLFCWQKNVSGIVYWDHEENSINKVNESYVDWLKNNVY